MFPMPSSSQHSNRCRYREVLFFCFFACSSLHAEQLKLVTDFDWIDFDRLSDVDELISSVLSCEEAADYIDEGRIHAITESVQRRIGHLQELAMTQMPRQLDTTEDDVREEVAADYAPKMEL